MGTWASESSDQRTSKQKSQPRRIGFFACLFWLLDLGSNQGPTD